MLYLVKSKIITKSGEEIPAKTILHKRRWSQNYIWERYPKDKSDIEPWKNFVVLTPAEFEQNKEKIKQLR